MTKDRIQRQQQRTFTIYFDCYESKIEVEKPQINRNQKNQQKLIRV